MIVMAEMDVQRKCKNTEQWPTPIVIRQVWIQHSRSLRATEAINAPLQKHLCHHCMKNAFDDAPSHPSDTPNTQGD